MSTLTKTTIVYYKEPTWCLNDEFKTVVHQYVAGLTDAGKSDGYAETLGFGAIRRYWIDQETAEGFLSFIASLAIEKNVNIVKTVILDKGMDDPDPAPLTQLEIEFNAANANSNLATTGSNSA